MCDKDFVQLRVDVHGCSLVASGIKDLSQRGVQVKISYESKMALEDKDFPRGQRW